MLPNGNVLLHTGPATIVEMTPEKKVVWEYTAKPKAPYTGAVEIHAFQRLKNDLTMIAETGNLRIIEVDKENHIRHEIPLTVDHPNSHRDTRMVRKLDNDLTMIAETGNLRIIEVDKENHIRHEIPLTVDHPNSHRDTRMVRKLDN